MGCRSRNSAIASSDGLGTLDLQQVTGAVDRAFVDLWQRGAEELGDLHPHGLRLTADHGQDRPVEPAACSAPKTHSVSAGSSMPKKVSASLIACLTAPGTGSARAGPWPSSTRGR